MAMKVNIGALWKRQGRHGNFMSGKITVNGKEIDIVVFPNKFAGAARRPDYIICESSPESKENERGHKTV